METDKAQTRTVRQSGTVAQLRYRSIRLTENEAAGAVAVNDETDKPLKLFITTKRPDLFSVGNKVRFRNKYSKYGWTIHRTEPIFMGRAEIVLKFPQKIYGQRRIKETV